MPTSCDRSWDVSQTLPYPQHPAPWQSWSNSTWSFCQQRGSVVPGQLFVAPDKRFDVTSHFDPPVEYAPPPLTVLKVDEQSVSATKAEVTRTLSISTKIDTTLPCLSVIVHVGPSETHPRGVDPAVSHLFADPVCEVKPGLNELVL